LYSRVAAVLLLPVLLFSIYYYLNPVNKGITTPWVEVHSPYGARTQFSLPDGSTGWLNSGSIIKYPVRFDSERTVTLNGEAYFDVVKNPDSPFTVDANQVKVKVLGTSFNVVSYDYDSISEVIVASGKVEVSSAGQILASKLLPSERLVLNRSKNRFFKSKVDIQNYTSWKTGKLIFLNDSLGEVVRKISRFYNVDFEVKENVNRKELFRAILQEESLEEVLRYMKLTMSIDYVIQERKQDQDGCISKRKVIIANLIKN
jgi:ferric-dicitrate binding protein FerR (iron transport regulator)